MRDRLCSLGWREIEVVDEDLGRTASGIVTRAGFERMVAEVCLGHVGAVAAREVSRFARNSREWQKLVEVCRVVDTLLIDQEMVYTPRQSNDRLLLGLKGSLNEYEFAPSAPPVISFFPSELNAMPKLTPTCPWRSSPSCSIRPKVSPRTVRKYLHDDRPGGGSRDQHRATFVRNHAKAIVACDFFVSVTATFQVLYVFVAMEIGSRRILHCNVTGHPTAEWTTQQFREILAEPHSFRFVVHNHDSIFSPGFDPALRDFGIHVLRTPVRAPKANAFCERLIGSIRRECLDYLIPFNERHLRRILKDYVRYYNTARPHSSLGPGVPEPIQASVPASAPSQLPASNRIRSTSFLGGLHHDYRLEEEAA